MATDNDVLNEDYLSRARTFIEHMESGEHDNAGQVLDEMVRLRESSLFQELGRLTREFHEALNSFRLDSRIANLAENDIPDARERLNYVIAMTEQAADRTLTAVEESLPLCDDLSEQAGKLHEEWERFTRREMDAAEFRELSRRLGGFLKVVTDDTGGMKNNLNEVLMAQDFQDLTGQIIRRVITLVEDVEGSLVELVRISGQSLAAAKMEEKGESSETTELDTAASGPPVPGVDKAETVSGQDEVDDLLSSLGF